MLYIRCSITVLKIDLIKNIASSLNAGKYINSEFILFSFNNRTEADKYFYKFIVKDRLLFVNRGNQYKIENIEAFEKQEKYIDILYLDPYFYVCYYPVYPNEIEYSKRKYESDLIVPIGFLENLCFV